MGQIAAALLFAVAAGLGITVILAMLKLNGVAILSALVGEGAFPIISRPATGPDRHVILLRPSMSRSIASRTTRGTAATQPISYAA